MPEFVGSGVLRTRVCKRTQAAAQVLGPQFLQGHPGASLQLYYGHLSLSILVVTVKVMTVSIVSLIVILVYFKSPLYQSGVMTMK